jgi:hypothetical protein
MDLDSDFIECPCCGGHAPHDWEACYASHIEALEEEITLLQDENDKLEARIKDLTSQERFRRN